MTRTARPKQNSAHFFCFILIDKRLLSSRSKILCIWKLDSTSSDLGFQMSCFGRSTVQKSSHSGNGCWASDENNTWAGQSKYLPPSTMSGQKQPSIVVVTTVNRVRLWHLLEVVLNDMLQRMHTHTCVFSCTAVYCTAAGCHSILNPSAPSPAKRLALESAGNASDFDWGGLLKITNRERGD